MSAHQSQNKASDIEYVRGFPIPKHPIFKPEYSEQAMEYEPHDGDVILFGYPKTGSTWLLYTVWNILHKCQRSLKDLGEMQVVETIGKEATDALPKPRLYKYHLPADRIQISNKAKYIYVYRNPADVLVSYYHFINGKMGVESEFDQFFEAFMAGKIAFGDYFDHVLASYKHKDDENFLMLAYEDAKKDPLGEVMRIAKFLGGEYYEPFVEDDSLAQKIVQLTSFDHMKKNLTFSGGEDESSKTMDYFFRKGVVGDGKATLSSEQMKRLNDAIRRKMPGTELMKEWLEME